MNTRTQGQVLLIGLMLIALVTTIVGTGALRSMSSTQTTKQKEESKKASNAAQGALEAGINNEDINYSDFTDVNPTGYAQSRAPKTIADLLLSLQ
jgi:Tfp pilus assembly protein PilX